MGAYCANVCPSECSLHSQDERATPCLPIYLLSCDSFTLWTLPCTVRPSVRGANVRLKTRTADLLGQFRPGHRWYSTISLSFSDPLDKSRDKQTFIFLPFVSMGRDSVVGIARGGHGDSVGVETKLLVRRPINRGSTTFNGKS